MEETLVTILCGVPGTGKSTFASEQGAIVISRDEIRKRLFGFTDENLIDYYNQDVSEKEKVVTWRFYEELKENLIKKPYHIIIDNTNLTLKYVKQIIDHCQGYQVRYHLKTFDLDCPSVASEDVLLAKVKEINKTRGRGKSIPETTLAHFVHEYYVHVDDIREYVDRANNMTFEKNMEFKHECLVFDFKAIESDYDMFMQDYHVFPENIIIYTTKEEYEIYKFLNEHRIKAEEVYSINDDSVVTVNEVLNLIKDDYQILRLITNNEFVKARFKFYNSNVISYK